MSQAMLATTETGVAYEVMFIDDVNELFLALRTLDLKKAKAFANKLSDARPGLSDIWVEDDAVPRRVVYDPRQGDFGTFRPVKPR